MSMSKRTFEKLKALLIVRRIIGMVLYDSEKWTIRRKKKGTNRALKCDFDDY